MSFSSEDGIKQVIAHFKYNETYLILCLFLFGYLIDSRNFQVIADLEYYGQCYSRSANNPLRAYGSGNLILDGFFDNIHQNNKINIISDYPWIPMLLHKVLSNITAIARILGCCGLQILFLTCLLVKQL